MSTYNSTRWRELRSRVLARDANCVLAGIAGPCRGALHVHHIDPVSEGGPEIPSEDGLVTLCGRHHRAVHGWLRRQDTWRHCPHAHRSREAREACERRLNSLAA